MTEPVKRFNVFPYLDDGVAELDITHDEDGGYVFADDHDRVVQELRAEVERLRAALEGLCDEFQRCFAIYYHAEPWAHDRNQVMKDARAALAGGEEG